jgi:osmotically-inducible protein OsmY
MTKTQDIRDAVELELSYDPLVNVSDITVKNINGEVALNGTVPSFPQLPGGGRSGAARLERQERA